MLLPLLGTGRLPLIIFALSGVLLTMGVIYGPMGAFLPELFPTEVRYSGASLAYSFGGVLGGAIPSLVSTQLQSAFGAASIGWYASAMAVISFGCILALPETTQRQLQLMPCPL
ncbi:MFS transporter [Streptomyces sp. NPDC059255]|uniref:MFS transporter n=1 Tax=Streptomyces sp. NPDC059255 TaxID=3346793 RepID=UPI003686E2D2